MQTETAIAQLGAQRVAELRRAVAAGEYAPAPDLIAGEMVAKLRLISRARRRIEALNDARFQPEAAPPRRGFEREQPPGERLSETL
jgi:hypothetical protein